jgi:hypothetical protein|nr:FixH family protein [uncultured Pseudoxanthomonas sp.]
MTSNASPASDRKRPFWKEPMMWVVLGIPLASIVAGVGLVVVSVRSGSADAVMDKVDRVSQIQTTDLGPDEAAAARKLSAIVQIRADHVELVPVTGEFVGTSPLVLTLAHPTEAAKDTSLTLARDTAGWTAPAQIDTSHDWNVQLATQDGLWRIRGRLQKDTRAVRLAPAHGGG